MPKPPPAEGIHEGTDSCFEKHRRPSHATKVLDVMKAQSCRCDEGHPLGSCISCEKPPHRPVGRKEGIQHPQGSRWTQNQLASEK